MNKLRHESSQMTLNEIGLPPFELSAVFDEDDISDDESLSLRKVDDDVEEATTTAE